MSNIIFENRDCMDAMKSFPDNFFDLAIVDPIYGVGHSLANERAYHRAMWEQPKTPPEYFAELRRVSRNQIVWGGNFFTENLPCSQGWIVWDKQKSPGLTYSDSELAWTSFNKAQRIFRFMWNGMLQGDMKNKERKIHPTQKPIALYKWLLENYAEPGDKILDTHVGSASSLIACYDMGFDAWGYEIDKTYYEQANKRLNDFMAQIRMPI